MLPSWLLRLALCTATTKNRPFPTTTTTTTTLADGPQANSCIALAPHRPTMIMPGDSHLRLRFGSSQHTQHSVWWLCVCVCVYAYRSQSFSHIHALFESIENAMLFLLLLLVEMHVGVFAGFLHWDAAIGAYLKTVTC